MKSPHDHYYWQLGNKNGQWVVRESDWKLYSRAHENIRPSGIKEMSKEDKKFFLVNLIKDPGERKNWAKDNPNKVEALALLAKKYQSDLENSNQ